MVSVNRTVLINISESGAAIEMELSSCPHLGERLKIELPIPGGDQIAWYARVVRTQLKRNSWWTQHAENEPEKVIVALRFEDLPQGHKKAIRQGLDDRYIEELRERRMRQWLYLKSLWIENTWKILGYAFGIFVVVGLLYWLSRPSANYDADHGAPWGQRYQFFNFEKQK